jgi:hypothetical protein
LTGSDSRIPTPNPNTPERPARIKPGTPRLPRATMRPTAPPFLNEAPDILEQMTPP